jgi:hypothetical protein
LIANGKNPYLVTRICDYFNDAQAELWVPYNAFPLIFFEKRRMDLAFLDKPELDLERIKDLVRRYLFKLDLKELFVPPPDILYKIGNQYYNDNGVIKSDYERPEKFDSGFKYQFFMAQPLQPREVWLPSKKIKHNNIFWMLLCRQFIKCDPTYPSSEPELVWERLKNIKSFFRFDISGFGFQFIREYLQVLVEVIEEMYP